MQVLPWPHRIHPRPVVLTWHLHASAGLATQNGHGRSRLRAGYTLALVLPTELPKASQSSLELASSPEVPRALRESPEFPKNPESFPKLSGAPESSLKLTEAPQGFPELPRAFQSSPELSRATQSSPELPYLSMTNNVQEAKLRYSKEHKPGN